MPVPTSSRSSTVEQDHHVTDSPGACLRPRPELVRAASRPSASSCTYIDAASPAGRRRDRADVIGLDWRMPTRSSARSHQHQLRRPRQPRPRRASRSRSPARPPVARSLAQPRRRRFNLGHGIVPGTINEYVIQVVDRLKDQLRSVAFTARSLPGKRNPPPGPRNSQRPRPWPVLRQGRRRTAASPTKWSLQHPLRPDRPGRTSAPAALAHGPSPRPASCRPSRRRRLRRHAELAHPFVAYVIARMRADEVARRRGLSFAPQNYRTAPAYRAARRPAARGLEVDFRLPAGPSTNPAERLAELWPAWHWPAPQSRRGPVLSPRTASLRTTVVTGEA